MKKSEESSSAEELNTENGKPIIPSNLSARKWKRKKKVDVEDEELEEPIKVNIQKGKHIELVQVHKKDGKVFNRKQLVSDKFKEFLSTKGKLPTGNEHLKKRSYGDRTYGVSHEDESGLYQLKTHRLVDSKDDTNEVLKHVIEHTKNGILKRSYHLSQEQLEHITKEPTKEKKVKEPQWFDEYTHLQLNKLPIGIPKENVKINTTGDTDTHWVMNWKDPKSGKMVQAYTKGFLQNNALLKWSRIEKIKQSDIDLVKGKSIALLNSKELSNSAKDAAAVIAIISHTGLRPGDEKGFKFSGNRGVSTLHSDNIKIVKDKIFFNFTGKSYKENNAFIQNKTLADYLKQRQATNTDKAFLFETNKKQIEFIFKQKVGMKGYKVKDMRTYIACDIARGMLEESKVTLTDNKKETKKIIEATLKNVFEKVSQQLNNSPAMAKSSYVSPNIIDAWVMKLGLSTDILKAESENSILSDFTLDNIIKWNNARTPIKPKVKEIDDYDDEMCIEFPQPFWME